MVVYLLIPTSNHNYGVVYPAPLRLFISWFLHQTTTATRLIKRLNWLFISWFLHQTTTEGIQDMLAGTLFISWFLHQTTTAQTHGLIHRRCLSLDSYIKPQLDGVLLLQRHSCLSLDSYIKPQRQNSVSCACSSCLSLDSYIKPQHVVMQCVREAVVYLLIPTSNHNQAATEEEAKTLFISWFLHQTTTLVVVIVTLVVLFISWFLHQTTTFRLSLERKKCCLSLDSYIKPQLLLLPSLVAVCCLSLDSYIKPQLNYVPCNSFSVVYLLIPTSNHNRRRTRYVGWYVVYLLIPTSNHNLVNYITNDTLLFISWFLHQTTTRFLLMLSLARCLSLDSYIKPQPAIITPPLFAVVYLLIPTSNHNLNYHHAVGNLLFISWFLHQTTTRKVATCWAPGCLSLDSYIKPQLSVSMIFRCWVVYLLIPTSNHNLPESFVRVYYVVYLLIPTSNHNGALNQA